MHRAIGLIWVLWWLPAGIVLAGPGSGLPATPPAQEVPACTVPTPERVAGRSHVSAIDRITRPALPASARSKQELAAEAERCLETKTRQASQDKINVNESGQSEGMKAPPDKQKEIIPPRGG